jgi:MFS transporter, DHA1 family, multidrug resistance protein
MSSVSNWKRNVFVLCFAVGCTSASYTMLIPFLPMYLLELGVSQSEVAMYSGGVFSVTFFVAAIMAPIWGKMADKKGKRLMAIRAGIGLSLTYFLGGFVTSPEQLFVVRILQGFANGFLPASLAIASSSAPPEELGSSLGIVQTGQILGMVLGPLLGGVIAEAIGMRSSFYLAGLLLFFVVLLVVFFVQEPIAEVEVMKNEKKSVKKLVKGDSILDDFRYAAHNRLLLEMLALTFIISLSNMVLQPVISLYIAQLQGSMENVMFTSGLIFSLGGVAGAISTAPWGAFGQRRGYFLVMVLAFCGAGIFNFLQYFPSTVVGFGVLQFFFGLFFVGTNPAVSAMLVKSTKADFRGRVFGLATTANQSGAMVGPLIGSFISMLFGIQYVFLITGPLLFFIGIAIWHRYLYTSV